MIRWTSTDHSDLSKHSSSLEYEICAAIKLIKTFIPIIIAIAFLILIFTINNLVKQQKFTAVLKIRPPPHHHDFSERWKTRATTEVRPRTTCRTPLFQTSVLGFRRWVALLLTFGTTWIENLILQFTPRWVWRSLISLNSGYSARKG